MDRSPGPSRELESTGGMGGGTQVSPPLPVQPRISIRIEYCGASNISERDSRDFRQ